MVKIEPVFFETKHAIVGLEYDINDKWTVNVEAYVKDFNQLINLNEISFTRTMKITLILMTN